ncbi:MAG: hypothetical protein REH83_05725, partial [Rickettsiella sp.]|nr:hypothetical protein [Rickettsiella sp.]
LSSGAGNAVGAIAHIVLPAAIFYLLVPHFYELFSFFSDKAVAKIINPNDKSQMLSLIPEGTSPLLELMCLLSTLAVIEKLTKELKLKGLDHVQFNILKLR